MGETLWGFKHTSFRRFSKTSEQHSDDHRHVGLTASIINFMKPRCLAGKAMKKKKRQLHNEREKHQQLLKNNSHLATLEEWILASPSFSGSFTNRVSPSLDGYHKGISCESREYMSMEKLMKLDDVDKTEDFSLCKCQSLKVKKRVSFRLPEVADIFILDSPEV